MKYCSKCGSEINDEAVVCTKCGCAVETVKKVENSDSESNNMALIGFILSFFVPIVGLIFGCIGLNKAKSLNDTGKGFAIAAIAISSVWLFCQLIWLIAFLSI